MTATLVGPHFESMSAANIILSARARRHSADVSAGPFSIKSVIEGSVTWRAAGQEFRIEPGGYLVLDRGEPYILDIDETRPVETFVAFFADNFVSDVAGARLRPVQDLLDDPWKGGSWLPILRRVWTGANELSAAMARLRRAAGAAADQGELDALLRAALDCCGDLAAAARDEIGRLPVAKPSTRRELHRRLTRGKTYFDSTYDLDFNLDAAAKAACLSPHHFHRSFRAAFGRTPFGYVCARRYERAAYLLANTDMPVPDVCAAIGFSSAPSFTRSFRKATGRTPADFRAQNRKDG